MSGADGGDGPEPPDKLEIWARRTGRALGFLVLLLLILYLIFTYVPR